MSANREALRMMNGREPVELGEGVTPERAVALVVDVIDLGYRAHGENGRASLAAVQIDWMMQQWADAEERFDHLLIAFHDAIRRPLGVTPDSGAEFYDPRMAEEAEERRRLKQAGGRHAYRPHKLYPHFCAQCGYAEREALMHLPAADAGFKERGGGSAS